MVKKVSAAISLAKDSKVKKAKPGILKHTQNGPTSKKTITGGQSSAAVKSKRGVPARSTAGFSLYSTDSEADASQKELAVKKPEQSVSKTRKGDGEVLTQIQLEEKRRTEPDIVIPVAGMETPSFNQSGEGFEVNTPFNKRLISSTPDPERLIQAELQEHAGHRQTGLSQERWQHENPALQSGDNPRLPPQLIPERDTQSKSGKSNFKAPMQTIGGIDPSVLKLKLSNELFERLKQQRQNTQILRSEASLGVWEKELRKYQHGNEAQDKTSPAPDDCSVVGVDVIKEKVDDELEFMQIPKAEWIVESNNDTKFSNNSANVYSSRGERSWNVLKMDTRIDSKTDLKPRKIPQGETSQIKRKSEDDNSLKEKTVKSLDNSKNSGLKYIPDKRPQSKRDSSKSKQSINDKPKPLNNQHGSHNNTVEKQKHSATVKTSDNTSAVGARNIESRGEGATTNSSPSDVDSVYQSLSHTASVNSKNSEMSHSSAFQPIANKDFDFNDFRSVVKKLNEAIPNLDLTADTCDEEVSMAISSGVAEENPNNKKGDTVQVASEGVDTQSSEGNNLSQVIEFLKTEAFAAHQSTAASNPSNYQKNEDGKCQTEAAGSEESSNGETERDSGVASHIQTPGRLDPDIEPSGNPEPVGTKTVNFDLCEIEIKEDSDQPSDEPSEDAALSNNHGETDTNQNCRNENDNRPKNRKKWTGPKIQKNLQYLDKMADPYLRETACRLAFKASAIRDIELRDLIDDMIYYTDAALAHEDARFHSSQMFFNEENGKLKKRVHNVNRQLDAKERQEKTGGLVFGSNDVLHLERKIMYLIGEKDRLDSQVTGLLEEKANWLMTQQDLVRAMSLKDHDILKLEEKHNAERMRLHQDLDQAMKGSSGVHYKLAVADKEITNLEERMKVKGREMESLKEKASKLQKALNSCQEKCREKDRSMEQLQDLVDTLKLGVNQVLQAYESGDQSPESDQNGIEMLRRMAGDSPNPRSGAGFNTTNFSKTSRHPLPQGRLQTDSGSRANRAEPSFGMQDSRRIVEENYRILNSLEHKRQDFSYLSGTKRLKRRLREGPSPCLYDNPSAGLTRQALEEHDRVLSPVDHSLWRSYDDSHLAPPAYEQESYFSDSEIYKRPGRRQKSRRRGTGGGVLDSSFGRDRNKLVRGQKHVCFCANTPPDSAGMFEVHCDCGPQREDKGPDAYFNRSLDRSQESRSRNRTRDNRHTTGAYFTSPRDRSQDRVREHEQRSRSRNRSLSRERDKSRERKVVNKHIAEKSTASSNKQRRKSSDLSNMTLESMTLRDSHKTGQHSSQHVSSSPASSRRFTQGIKNGVMTSTKSKFSRSDFLSSSFPTTSKGKSFTTLKSQSPQKTFASSSDAGGDRLHFVSLIPDKNQYYSPETLTTSTKVRFDTPSPRYQYGTQSLCSDSSEDGFVHSHLPERGSEFNSERLSYPTQSSPRDFSEISFSRIATRGSGGNQEFQNDQYRYPTQSDQQSYYGHSGGQSYCNQSSPRRLSDISMSRLANRGSGGNITQADFFQGTELAASISSIDSDMSFNNRNVGNLSWNNNNEGNAGAESFSTGFATLDEKIANLQAKINHTKATFS